MLYRRAPISTLTGVAFALLMCIGLLPYTNAHWVWSWFALRCTVAGSRLLLSQRFFRDTTPQGVKRWRHRFIAVLAVDGLSWALASLWLVPHAHLEVTALMLTALVGVASIGLFVLQPSFPASSSFLTMLLLPVALSELLQGHRFGLFSGIGLLMFLGLILVEAHRAEARIRELLSLRFSTDRIAEERAEALRLAERQSGVKSQFLATMSHEMRTPLHGILGLTRMLQSTPSPASPQLALIERAGEHLLTLINDVLDFSKFEAGQVPLATQEFDLAAVIDEVTSLLMPQACEARLSLTARVNLPRPCLVQGDPSRVRQVLHNLVGNAIKFTAEGSVTVIAKHHRGRARIAVHDTGVGIPASELPLIFDAFHQADGSFARRYAGTGLGLTIARELARAMGGDLVATSQPGRGSCFTVSLSLPAAQITEAANEPVEINLDEAMADLAEATEPALSGLVLLAEDNPVNALVAEAALQRMGFTVNTVGDGEQALAAFQSQRPDLVLLDCQMPVMDGLEAARRIREHEVAHGLERTPLVALTANALEGDRELSLAAGMDDHLAKPFRDEALRSTLHRLLMPVSGR